MPALKKGQIPQVLATEYARYRGGVIKEFSKVLFKTTHSKSPPLVLYDPMAGTAPLLSLAERNGCTAYFNDLNCLHLYVNAAKTFQSYLTFKSIGSVKLLQIIHQMASGLDYCPRVATEKWIDRAVLEELTSVWKKSEEQEEPFTILTKAILLLSIRNFSSFIKTTNPTWLKPGGLRPKITAEQAIKSAIDRLNFFYQNAYEQYPEIKGGKVVLTNYDASLLGPGCKVDIVVTSPPFCNRVDWDRMYAPEHFFLDAVGVWHTRTEFLGTSSVRRYSDFDSELKFVTGRSDYVGKFLSEVRKRQIRKERESDYYIKYFTRYFAGLFRVFDVASSALSEENAGIYFVVQDNRHRALQIDIGQALAESLTRCGFQMHQGKSWDRHHMGLRNVSKRYSSVSPMQKELIWHAVR